MKKLYSLLLLLTIFSVSNVKAQVVISQVYGGGGNGGATYTNDFIEIFNRGTVAVDLTGWSVQYASAAGTSWAVQPLTAFTLQSGQYYLIQCAAGATPSTALPTPDSLPVAPPGLAMSGSGGKVLLANTITAQTGLIPVAAEVMDLVGYGTSPTGFEGTGPTGTALTSTTAASRLSGGCIDTNNNAADFQTGLPAPRNSATAVTVCSTAPSLAISSPLNSTIFNPNTTSVTVNVAVSNFTVANGTGTGHIHYTVDGGAVVMKYDTAPIVLSGLNPGSHTVNMFLVNNSHAPLSPAVNASVQFTIASFTPAADIAAIRADVTANGYGKYYQLTSSPVVSYKRTARNQKYVQDASAGMLIDDVLGTITSTVVDGDALSGLQGQSFNFNGVLEFLPIANASVASSGNVITPEVVTAAAIAANIDAYESELVQINGSTFALGDGTATFASNTDFTVNAGATILFRTMFTEVDYLTAPNNVIPTGANNIIVLVSENNGVAKVVARNLANLTLAKDSFNAISGLSVYPNPVKNGVFYINSDANAVRTVTVYDVVGKQVLNTTTSNGTVNVSSLNAGIYMVKITEEGKTATKKLVIE